MKYKKSFSKSAKREFAQKMEEIAMFCKEHGISQSCNGDSYYFVLNGKHYRISNHTVEASNRAAYDDFGNRLRESYHPNGREDDVVYITASKTRLMDIYCDLANGYAVDGRGFRKGE